MTIIINHLLHYLNFYEEESYGIIEPKPPEFILLGRAIPLYIRQQKKIKHPKRKKHD